MQKIWHVIALGVCLSFAALAQTSSLTGTVTDPTGAVVPSVKISIVSLESGAERTTESDKVGGYVLVQVPPGKYRLTAKAPGFSDVIINNLDLEVNQASTVEIKFEKLGATSTAVSIEATSAQVNTSDATIGNAIGSTAIVELPSYARNVANLLQFQPGVTPSLNTANGTNNTIGGNVNGGKADQANVTLDGVDVNDQNNRTAFTTVLRMTLDSVEEFRTVTTNGGAEGGRGSGADTQLVTKSGTNQVHGSLYEYRRGTETAANTFANNSAGVPVAPLLINIFGGTIGGPIKKNKAFLFFNYEGRRDASAVSVTRTVPTATLQQGIVEYKNSAGVVQQVLPSQQPSIDPLGVGIDQAALAVFKLYPAGNYAPGGDGLNTTGYLFNAPGKNVQNTYIAKLDYRIDDAGKHSLFWRGNLQNDSASNGSANAPEFPGQVPNSVTLANNKGYAAGYTAVLTPNFVNNFHYGLTRVGNQTTGILGSPYTLFRGYSTIYGTSTGTTRIIPVHTFSDDLSWNKGTHSIRFGGVFRLISDQSLSYSHSYNSGTTNPSVINGSGADLTPASLGVSSSTKTSYQYAEGALLGVVASATGNYNYLTNGTLLAPGAPVARNFVSKETEGYITDSWKVVRNLTITYGLRLSFFPAPHEANGQQISSNIPIGEWANTRGQLASQGLSQMGAGLITYVLPQRPIYPMMVDPSPRLSVAWSPSGESGLKKFLTGGTGKTSVRAGFGMYYDDVGQPLVQTFNSTAFGLSTTLSTSPNVLTSAQLPRFTGFYSVPAAILAAPPPGGFPATYPNGFAITNSVDDHLRSPYSMNIDFAIQREFSHGYFFQAAYVGRLSRHNLTQHDLAMPTNLTDPKSGQTYFQAMTQLGTLLDLQGVSVANLPKIPFFENMWSKAAGNGYTATQVIALDYTTRSNPGDWTNTLSDMDNGQACGANGSVFNAAGKLTQTGCGNLGAYSMWSPQFSALAAQSSVGSGSYHAAQFTLRKRFSQGLLFDFNYTFSKSMDLGSTPEGASTFSDVILNTWNSRQMKAVSDYDTTNQANAYFVYDIPVGRGRRFGGQMNKILDAFVGGWELTGTFRDTSAFPFAISDGSRWATNWEISSGATPSGLPQQARDIQNSLVSTNSSVNGRPNLWANPAAELAAFQETMAGQSGTRNSSRLTGIFDIDSGLYKNFKMPYSEKHVLQFRWETYNLTNSVQFSSVSVSLTSSSTFGLLSGQRVDPRQMQFAMRYTF
jgi:Carboxypeptidase regulatory-like domain